MTGRSVADKARVKAGAAIAVVDGVPAIVDGLGLPDDVTFVSPERAHLVFLFVKSEAQLASKMPATVAKMSTGAVLWVFFRKGGKAAGREVGRDEIWAIAEQLGMRPIGLISVDDTWSTFRLKGAA
jgi:hypothetical protein